MKQLNLVKLGERYAQGKASADDFRGIKPEDALAIRTDRDTGANVIAVPEALADVGTRDTLADLEDDEDSPIPYLMLTEKPIGGMKDIFKIGGFGFELFNQRGRPFLFNHNFGGDARLHVPLGTMSKPTRHRKFQGLRAMHGFATFAPRGISEFHDMTQDLVRMGVLNCGSVGLEIVDARMPKDEKEAEKLGCEPYSMIVEKALLREFSAVPLGRDPDARAGVQLSNNGEQRALKLLADGVRTGRYDKQAVQEFRAQTAGFTPQTRILSQGIDLPQQPESASEMDNERAEAIEGRLAQLEASLESTQTLLDEKDDLIASLEARQAETDEALTELRARDEAPSHVDAADDDELLREVALLAEGMTDEQLAASLTDEAFDALFD